MDLRKFELITVRLDQLISNEVQPEKRHDATRIKDLKDIISQTEILLPPVVTRYGSKYLLHDGHRRRASAEALGLSEIQCLLIGELSEESISHLFFVTNCYTKPVSGSERVQAWVETPEEYRESVLDAMRGPQAKQITDLVEMLGEALVREMARKGRPLASAAKCVRSIRSWCTGHGHPQPSARAIVRWCIEQKGFRLIDTVARNPTPKTTGAIVAAILEKRAFQGPRR